MVWYFEEGGIHIFSNSVILSSLFDGLFSLFVYCTATHHERLLGNIGVITPYKAQQAKIEFLLTRLLGATFAKRINV